MPWVCGTATLLWQLTYKLEIYSFKLLVKLMFIKKRITWTKLRASVSGISPDKCSDKDVVVWVHQQQAFLWLTSMGYSMKFPETADLKHQIRPPPTFSSEFMESGSFDGHWKWSQDEGFKQLQTIFLYDSLPRFYPS